MLIVVAGGAGGRCDRTSERFYIHIFHSIEILIRHFYSNGHADAKKPRQARRQQR